MNVSFGKFIPVRVFLRKEFEDNGEKKLTYEEIKWEKGEKIPEPVALIPIAMSNCLMRHEDYPYTNTILSEQQRMFFESKVDDYKRPNEPTKTKDDSLPSRVRTENIEGVRYLVTGKDDFNILDQAGQDYGKGRNDLLDTTKAELRRTYPRKTNKELMKIATKARQSELNGLNNDRLANITRHMTRNKRVLDQTLCIYAQINPEYRPKDSKEGKKSPNKDKYKIDLIGFNYYRPY